MQFDRVAHQAYADDKTARQIQALLDAGHGGRVLVAHDRVPYFYESYTSPNKSADGWKFNQSDFTVCTSGLVEALVRQGVDESSIRTILVDNPRSVLAF